MLWRMCAPLSKNKKKLDHLSDMRLDSLKMGIEIQYEHVLWPILKWTCRAFWKYAVEHLKCTGQFRWNFRHEISPFSSQLAQCIGSWIRRLGSSGWPFQHKGFCLHNLPVQGAPLQTRHHRQMELVGECRSMKNLKMNNGLSLPYLNQT